ncbi:hypothetical protein [Burkholderia stabilis]
MGTCITHAQSWKFVATLAATLLSLSASAASFTIGSQSIEVPAPPGLVGAPDTGTVADVAKKLTPPRMTVLGDYFAKSDLVAAENEGIEHFKPRMWARLMTPGIPGQTVPLSAERFRTLPSELATVQTSALSGQVAKQLEKSFGDVGLDVSKPQTTVVNDNFAMIAMGSKFSFGTVDLPVAVVTSLVRIKDRLVMASVYRVVKSPSDITAARTYAKDWGTAIEKANPPQ